MPILHGMEWSFERLAMHPGQLIINPLIFSELCYRAETKEAVEHVIEMLGLAYYELSKAPLVLAAQAFKQYRLRGGTKSAPLADFFIGAHAQADGHAILTRDKSRYETYFPEVQLIYP